MSDTDLFADLADSAVHSLDTLLNIRDAATYLVRVEGDSMEGAGIFSGDILVVSKAAEPVRGNIVIAVINGEPMCKCLDYSGVMPVLRSENPRYATRYVLEGEEFSVWGVVTHCLRSHN
ncbi:LexA family protein (plasmid) [Pseudomonas sp. A1437]|uniref:LexA family protein n=1 Tax=Pseudomonas sp. A1437 TaxID=3235107 RepID=UPI003783086E